jgi:hypothetical protein
VHAGEPLEHPHVLERLAQALDRAAAELRELDQERDAAMRRSLKS